MPRARAQIEECAQCDMAAGAILAQLGTILSVTSGAAGTCTVNYAGEYRYPQPGRSNVLVIASEAATDRRIASLSMDAPGAVLTVNAVDNAAMAADTDFTLTIITRPPTL
jgi:hypothetical protein